MREVSPNWTADEHEVRQWVRRLKGSVLTDRENISPLEEGSEFPIFPARKNITESLSYEEMIQKSEKATTTKKVKKDIKVGVR